MKGGGDLRAVTKELLTAPSCTQNTVKQRKRNCCHPNRKCTHFKFLAIFDANVSRIRTVSEYCLARVSRVGLSTKQATEPYSDNLLNRTWNPSEPYSDKEIAFRRALIGSPLTPLFLRGGFCFGVFAIFSFAMP